jgi:membrane protein
VSLAVGLGDPTDEILGAVGDNLPPDVASQIAPQLEQVLGQTRPGLLTFGALLALWAAASAISSLMSAMNKAYDVDETRNFFLKSGLAVLLTLVGSVGVIFAFVTLVGGSVASQQLVQQLAISEGVWTTISLIRFPIVLVMVAIAVAVLFRFGPNVAVSFRWTLVGGFVFAVGWVAATVLFSIYVANFANYANTYGALGGVIVLMLWFYITALLLLVAAEVVSVLVKEHEPEVLEARREVTGPRGAAKEAKRSGETTARKVVRGAGAVSGTVEAMAADATGAADGDTVPEATPADPSARLKQLAPNRSAPQGGGLNPVEPALVIAKEAAGAATGADSHPRMSVGKRAGAFAMLGVAAVVGAIAGLLGGDDDKGATA